MIEREGIRPTTFIALCCATNFYWNSAKIWARCGRWESPGADTSVALCRRSMVVAWRGFFPPWQRRHQKFLVTASEGGAVALSGLPNFLAPPPPHLRAQQEMMFFGKEKLNSYSGGVDGHHVSEG